MGRSLPVPPEAGADPGTGIQGRGSRGGDPGAGHGEEGPPGVRHLSLKNKSKMGEGAFLQGSGGGVRSPPRSAGVSTAAATARVNFFPLVNLYNSL